ncbi:MAG: hydroxyacid dehydrogenase [Clostridia bacterium]|nr:hydroxyacid dehydrogenase [Clostridia bacterium]
MKISILDAATLGEDLSLEVFKQYGEVTVYDVTRQEQVEERLEGAEAVILNKVKLNAGNLANAKDLKLICITATGFDNVDVAYCREHGIAVCNVVGYSTQCVAQITVTMVLSLLANLPEYNRFVCGGDYTKSGCFNRLTPVFHEIYGKTWGIVGYGNIGKQVARVADALGCRVLVHKRTPVSERECVDFDTICRESDILSLHTPLNEGTYHLLDEKHISMLKPSAIVINVARGAVADERALADAIAQNRIGGLGVDVYSAEPMAADHPFQSILDRPNICLTPHMAWGGYETRVRLMDEIAQNITSFLKGERRCRVD